MESINNIGNEWEIFTVFGVEGANFSLSADAKKRSQTSGDGEGEEMAFLASRSWVRMSQRGRIEAI